LKKLFVLGCLTMAAQLGSADMFENEREPQAGQVYISGGTLFMGLERERDVKSFFAPSLGLGAQITDQFALELHTALGDSNVSGMNGSDVDIAAVRVDALYKFGREDWRPYIVGGVSRVRYDFDDLPNDTAWMANFGAGVRGALTRKLSVQADGRGFFEPSESRVTPGMTLTLSYALGRPQFRDSDGDGVADAHDACPGTPAGVAVDSRGCPLDSDGDGVPDYRDACPDTPAGVAVDNRGCPLDSDGDGVPDYRDACPDTPAGTEVDARGCPVEAEAPAEPEVIARFELQLTFAHDSSSVRAEDRSQVDRVAQFLREHPRGEALLEGHTDSRGPAAYNQRLSEQRANAVRAYLLERGIDARRITAVGIGEDRPIASNATDEGRARNRRVEVVVTQP